MKGLVRNNFYSMENNVKMSFVMALFLSVAALFIPSSAAVQVIISTQLFIFIANTGTSLHEDEVSRWNKFELTLPVEHREIIKAKYISFGMLFLFGMAMAGVTALVTCAVNGASNIQSVLYGYEFGLTLSATTAGIMYPLVLKMGTEKSELIMILSAALSVGVIVLVSVALAPLTGEMNMKHSLVGVISTAVALAIFVGSGFVSVKILKNKEFV